MVGKREPRSGQVCRLEGLVLTLEGRGRGRGMGSGGPLPCDLSARCMEGQGCRSGPWGEGAGSGGSMYEAEVDPRGGSAGPRKGGHSHWDRDRALGQGFPPRELLPAAHSQRSGLWALLTLLSCWGASYGEDP